MNDRDMVRSIPETSPASVHGENTRGISTGLVEVSLTSPQASNESPVKPAEAIDTPQAKNETGENIPVESRETAFPVAGTTNDSLPPSRWKFLRYLSPFWHDRLIEAGLILSLGLYYVVGNPNLGAGSIGQIPPYLYSFP